MTIPGIDMDDRPIRHRSASFGTPDGRIVMDDGGPYRYTLTRTWTHPSEAIATDVILWVMLNPSTANAMTDDHTIRKCIGYARRWHADGIIVVNLFAYRATAWRDLLTVDDPVGPANDELFIGYASKPRVRRVVAAWGTFADRIQPGRADNIADRIARHRTLWCLGTTKAGHPKHPLMTPYDAELVQYRNHVVTVTDTKGRL